MEIKDLHALLKPNKEFDELLNNINISINNINTKHQTIVAKYKDDTQSKFHDHNIIFKNLLIYLFIKNGIKLDKPTEIANTKYSINVNSKKLIMYEKSMNFSFTAFIRELKNLSNENIKKAVNEFDEYYEFITTTMNGNIHVRFISITKTTEDNNIKYDIILNCGPIEYDLNYTIIDNKDRIGSFELTTNLSTHHRHNDISFNEDFIKLDDNLIIKSFTALKELVFIELQKYYNSLEKYIKLLNEYSLI